MHWFSLVIRLLPAVLLFVLVSQVSGAPAPAATPLADYESSSALSAGNRFAEQHHPLEAARTGFSDAPSGESFAPPARPTADEDPPLRGQVFGHVPIGTQAVRQITVSWEGSYTITDIRLTGADAFRLHPDTPETPLDLPANGIFTFKVIFAPQTAGEHKATYSVRVESKEDPHTEVTLSILEGYGDAMQLDFRTVSPDGFTSSRAYGIHWLYNDDQLEINDIEILGDAAFRLHEVVPRGFCPAGARAQARRTRDSWQHSSQRLSMDGGTHWPWW